MTELKRSTVQLFNKALDLVKEIDEKTRDKCVILLFVEDGDLHSFFHGYNDVIDRALIAATFQNLDANKP